MFLLDFAGYLEGPNAVNILMYGQIMCLHFGGRCKLLSESNRSQAAKRFAVHLDLKTAFLAIAIIMSTLQCMVSSGNISLCVADSSP